MRVEFVAGPSHHKVAHTSHPSFCAANMSGQITADLTPVISNPMGVSADGYPNVFQRSVNTTVRLDNGQTLVLGGLLRGDEQNGLKKIPILGDIPILGALFRTSTKKNIQTNLVIYITPHIIAENDTINLASELKKLEKGYGDNTFSYDSFGKMLDRGQASGSKHIEKKHSRLYHWIHRNDDEPVSVTTVPASLTPAAVPVSAPADSSAAVPPSAAPADTSTASPAAVPMALPEADGHPQMPHVPEVRP